MSGFLRRLARQATLQEPGAVHPRARLPFANPPVRWEAEEELGRLGPDVAFQHRRGSAEDRGGARFTPEADASPNGALLGDAENGGSAGNASGSGLEPEGPNARVSGHQQASQRRSVPGSLPPGFHGALSGVGSHSGEDRAIRIPRRLVSASAPKSDSSADPGSRIGEAPVLPSPSPGAPPSHRDSPHGAPPGPQRTRSGPTGGTATEGPPGPGPNADGFHRPFLPQSVSRQGIFQVGRAEEPEETEVHVHIGRIEVTATSDSAIPARSQEAERDRPEPMSLDEYLARRQRRPS